MNQKIILFSIISCLAFGGTQLQVQVCAQEKEGSMDDVWTDNHASPGASSTDTPSSTSAATSTPVFTSLDSFSVTKLKSSEFVNLVSWPQIVQYEDIKKIKNA